MGGVVMEVGDAELEGGCGVSRVGHAALGKIVLLAGHEGGGLGKGVLGERV